MHLVVRCFSLVASALVFLGLAYGADGEKIYSRYLAINTVNFTATTSAQCISACLSTDSCVAVSYCTVGQSVFCLLSKCGNVNLVKSSVCNTIVFGDILMVEGTNLPKPSHEWISTDTCGVSNACAANVYGASLYPIGSLSGAGYYAASGSYFFGKSPAGDRTLFQVSNAAVGADTISIFFMYRLLDSGRNSTLCDLSISSVTNDNVRITLSINSAALYIYNSNTAPIYIGQTNVNESLLPTNQWTSTTLTYNATTGIASLFLNSVKIYGGYIDTLASSSSGLRLTMQIGSDSSYNNNATVYCLKVFNSSLTSSTIIKLRTSCEIGKVSYVDAPDASNAQTGNSTCPPASFSLDGKNYYNTLSPTTMTWTVAKDFCKNLNLTWVKIESLGEFQYLTTFITASAGYWISLYGSYSQDKFVWLYDNSTTSKANFPSNVFSIDRSEVSCYSMGNNILRDEDCASSISFYPLCTC